MVYIVVLLGNPENPEHIVMGGAFFTLEEAKITAKGYKRAYPKNEYKVYKCEPLEDK